MHNYVRSRLAYKTAVWIQRLHMSLKTSVVTWHKDNAIAQSYEADITEGLSVTADMPSVDDGTESAPAAAVIHFQHPLSCMSVLSTF